jgi:hypothetical protein
MSIYDIEAFFRWLREANDQELSKRAEALDVFLEQKLSPETQSPANYYLSRIREEQLGRIMKPKQ